MLQLHHLQFQQGTKEPLYQNKLFILFCCFCQNRHLQLQKLKHNRNLLRIPNKSWFNLHFGKYLLHHHLNPFALCFSHPHTHACRLSLLQIIFFKIWWTSTLSYFWKDVALLFTHSKSERNHLIWFLVYSMTIYVYSSGSSENLG